MYADDHEDFLPPLVAYDFSDHDVPWRVNWSVHWHRLLWYNYLGKNTNVFQCAGNSRLRWALSHAAKTPFDLSSVFNFAYGANGQTFVSEKLISGGARRSNSPADYYSRKVSEIVSPADCVSYGDLVGWQRFIVGKGFFFPHLHAFFPRTLGHRPWLVSSRNPKYTFGISRRHAGRSNMAFLDGHVEHGSLRDWTLPVSAVWDRWHHRNQWPVEDFQDLPADDWAPLYGADEHVDF